MTMTAILTIVAIIVGAMVAVLMVYGRWLQWSEKRLPSSTRRPPIQGEQPKGGAGDSGAAPKQISAALRAELEQTPHWWFTTFHQLLRASGAEQVGGEEWELSTFSGPVYMHREVGYPDCPCRECRRICQ